MLISYTKELDDRLLVEMFAQNNGRLVYLCCAKHKTKQNRTKTSVPDDNTDERIKLNHQAGNLHSRDIVSKFLQCDPSQRLGNLAGGMDEARKHPYFAEIDWQALAHKQMPVSKRS